MILRRLTIRPLFLTSLLFLAIGVAFLHHHRWLTCPLNNDDSSFPDIAKTSKRNELGDGNNMPKDAVLQEHLRKNGENRTTPRKLVLFWTPKLGAEDWTWGLGSEPFRGCQYSNCEFSSDKERVEEATMLLFYCREKPHYPAVRHPHQLYAHFSREPPHQVGDDYSMYSDYINMSISYRRDGNIHAPYFEIVPYEGGSRQPYTPRIPFSEKTRNVIWMSSNCRPHSKRDVYVTELQKYIDVDVFGRCGNYSCPLGNYGDIYRNCFEQFEKKYKFYLSFENAICRDYFTEKLVNPLSSELVPIVFGGADYDLELPPHSFINVRDFGSPKKLANFLRHMSADRYYSYFKWKSDYFTRNTAVHCKLCEFLHSSGYARGERIRPPYSNNYTAWMYDSCDNSLIDEMMKKW